MSDIHIAWKRITKGLPKSRKFGQDRAPTSEEIRKVINYPDRRIKPIVLLMSASGIKVGAWDFLKKWGDIETITRGGSEIVAAKIRVYAGEPDEYKTFITPEAYHAIKEWLDFRAEYGEKIGPHSWIMRNLFKSVTMKPGANRGMAAAPRMINAAGVRNMIRRAWTAQGLRNPEGSEDGFKSSHGFRKRFKTQCELAGVKPLNVEWLLDMTQGKLGLLTTGPQNRSSWRTT
jgi:integrase